MAVETTSVYLGDLRCEAIHLQSGGKILTDAPLDNRGKGEAFSPTDLVGASIGTCILTIMGIAAFKEDMDIDGTQIKVVKEMIDVPFRRIKRLDVIITFPEGLKLTERQRKVLEAVPAQCPVSRSLHPDVELVVTFAN